MRQRIEVMLDLETTDLAETAAILEMAMVPFFLNGEDCVEQEIHRYIDLTTCFLEGMTFSRETQKKWMEWDAQARAKLCLADKRPVRSVIAETYHWLKALGEKYELHIWCRGKNFDLPKYERCVRLFMETEEMPYKFWNTEDARDYPHTFGVHAADVEFVGIPHCSLDDCHHQIKQVQMAYRRQQMIERYAKIGLAGTFQKDKEMLKKEYAWMFGENISEQEINCLMSDKE